MERLAAARFLEDLKRARSAHPPFIFDEWYARQACDFIECLPHVEGSWDTPAIRLVPEHVFFVVCLFGFRRRDPLHVPGWGDDGLFHPRRFTSALLCVARKNAKSTLAAAILIYCECCEPEEGAQVISAATTFGQASQIFMIARRMVLKTPALIRAFGLSVLAKSITRLRTGAKFSPIHAKASTQDGLNPSHTALDEIHAHKTADLLNVLTSAAGGRSNPLWLYTTTEGYTNPGPWGELRRFAEQLLEGVFGISTDHFLVLIFALDKDDGEFDERAWLKANPLLRSGPSGEPVNPHLTSAIRKEATEAKAMPSKMAEFRIKRLNRQSAAAGAAIDMGRWNRCTGSIDLEALRGQPCYGALDLSSTTDLASWRLVWLVKDMLYTWGRRWVPADAVKSRTERGTVPYAGWAEAGLISITSGNVMDYDVIEKAVRADCERFRPAKIAYDRWNASDLINRLSKALPSDTLVEFIQGPRSYHPAIKEFERKYMAGNIKHGDDPVLTWCVSNLIWRSDVNMNLAPDKKKAPEKIDDATALLMAIGAAVACPTSSKEYSLLFV